jgi:hypothetical protein
MIAGPRRTSVSLTMNAHPSDSTPQGNVERAILQRLSAEHPEWQPVDWRVAATELGLSSVWSNAKPDAVWRIEPNELIVAECYAHVGVLKSGHLRKLAMDALKLLTFRQQCSDARRLRCIIVVPGELREQLERGGWLCTAIRMAANLMPVVLLDDERKLLVDTIRRQADGQARSRKPEKARHPE